jgi:hypothetical protein
MDPVVQKRINDLYADMKPLMEYYGIRPRTIEERYQDYLTKQALVEELAKAIPRPRFKLPKL